MNHFSAGSLIGLTGVRARGSPDVRGMLGVSHAAPVRSVPACPTRIGVNYSSFGLFNDRLDERLSLDAHRSVHVFQHTLSSLCLVACFQQILMNFGVLGVAEQLRDGPSVRH